MTVPSRELWLTPADSLVTHSKFYPTKITVSHHQLRHFISSSEKDLIYYVSCKDVFVLDLATQQNSLIATIPFESRCLAADLGWVCVGGEQNGDCAFIKVEKDEHDRPTCFGHDMHIDLLGGEIVNAMSIHTVLNHGKTPDEPVVLISNNDKTVKIYSLAQRQVLTTLPHPVPMNFAALSPDSTILAAVGDSDRVYFYRRHLEEDRDMIDGSSGRYAKYHWQMFANPAVPTGEPVYDDHSFAVTFSPSGYLCAASSQGGSISIFDMRHLLSSNEAGESSIICTFRSSRQALFGCVRSMTFSPAPWDLLVWAEDHGRIGVADVRQSCVRRQILDLDRLKTEEVKLEDGTPVAFRNIGHKERLMQQRLARLRAMRSLSSREVDNELSADDLLNESGQRPNRRDLVNYEGLDLDAHQRSIDEALDTLMDNMGLPPARPAIINSSSPGWIAGRLANDAASQPLGTGRPVGPRSHEPRRRSSVVLSEPNQSLYLDLNPNSRARLSASPARIGDDEDRSAMSTNTLTPASGSDSQSGPSSIPPNDPWHVIQTALESTRVSDYTNRSRALLARVEAALEAERQLGSQLERQLADERQLSLLLRRQLDNQQRLLSENSNQLDQLRVAARESNDRIAASLERIAQQQLTFEQQYLQQRSQELQSELRVGTEYSRRLQNERDRILGGGSGTDQNASTPSDSSSARTTTLPTTNLRASGQSDNVPAILTDYSESSRQRLAHIENLERQVRRAESRVAQAVLDTQALENAIQHDMGARFAAMQSTLNAAEARLASIRTRTVANLNEATTASNTAGAGSSQREPLLINRPSVATAGLRRGPMPMPSGSPAQRAGDSSGNEAGRVDVARSGVAGRVPDADMRMARIMFLSGVSGNRSIDANGNWTPPANESGLHRVLGAGGRPMLVSGGPGQVELGTTGIAFSPDGQSLYAGSEEGIFEFKVNLRDRMAFPSFEVR
ncbi:uncharacterized protein Z520_09601 [Fonsecaea multimorphosa CBS 102226]|uniref:DUF2415 domain-containing protein n=1 Tax=Fonsecaea multimorphosa CBS 102226 TaxID=1442371 RepID=A0A0D2GYB9_9EURO|nr:uncharacterized protein Z520_09601 [Fonsecaea multimorphosa CBS 102226]KIX94555.1 hypothetical protein Z520_09601 [Fonsecaea multimorphosa CBS 102226]